MNNATRLWPSLLTLVVTVTLAGCNQSGGSSSTSQLTPSTTVPLTSTSEVSSSPTIQNILDLPTFAPLAVGTYYTDPDSDPSTPLQVLYTISEEGWLQWIGAVQPEDADGEAYVGISIVTVANVMVDACVDQRPADPPIGPTVDDLAAALAELPPFQVTKPPTDVTIYGYSGRHLELTIPDDIPFELRSDGGYWTECGRGQLQSWIAPGGFDYFYGYGGPGQVEEFWILDVDGTRLMIQATWFPESPPQDLAEMRTILDSIRIEP